MSLQIKSSFDNDNNEWEIDLTGEIDISSVNEFRESLEKAYKENKGDITLRFDNLNYIDSTGIGVIIGTYGKMKADRNRIRILNPKKNIRKLLTITSLDQILL